MKYMIIILVKVMPPEFKNGRSDHRRHHSSSSSSSQHHKEHKSHKNQKWHKRSRSRSRSNPKHQHRHKHYYQYHGKDNYKYTTKPYENRRQNEYRKDRDFRRRAPSEEKRERVDTGKHSEKYGIHRYQEKQRNDLKKYQRREKSIEHKHWQSSPSQSKSKSPKNPKQQRRYEKSSLTMRQSQRQAKDPHINEQQPNSSRLSRPQETLKIQVKDMTGKDKEVEKNRTIEREVIQAIENNPINRPKIMMKMPIPPPPPSHPKRQPNRDYRESTRQDYRRDNKKQYRGEDRVPIKEHTVFHKEQKQYKKEERKQQFHAKPSINIARFEHQEQRLSPIKRNYEQCIEKRIQLAQPEIEKAKVSKFDMILNQARINLVFPTPPITFMSLETFRNMNKFEMQTLDPRWSSQLRNQLQKVPDLRNYLLELPKQGDSTSPHLWTYLKQERNAEQQDLKLRMEQLKLQNTTIADLARKLKAIE